VLYFTTEHHRMNTLKNELKDIKSLEKVTTKELNNKFGVARVEL
jgi:hypothetical protein